MTSTLMSRRHIVRKGDPAERVTLLRRRLGMSQYDLAEQSGVEIDTIRALEQGRRRGIRDKTLDKLATALQTTRAYLLTPID